SIDVVLELTADTDELVTRLLGRAAEQNRSDDTEPVIRRRLEVYSEQTAPLVTLYDERGLLVRVDGLGTVDEVTQRILDALGRAARTGRSVAPPARRRRMAPLRHQAAAGLPPSLTDAWARCDHPARASLHPHRGSTVVREGVGPSSL